MQSCTTLLILLEAIKVIITLNYIKLTLWDTETINNSYIFNQSPVQVAKPFLMLFSCYDKACQVTFSFRLEPGLYAKCSGHSVKAHNVNLYHNKYFINSLPLTMNENTGNAVLQQPMDESGIQRTKTQTAWFLWNHKAAVCIFQCCWMEPGEFGKTGRPQMLLPGTYSGRILLLMRCYEAMKNILSYI